MQRRESEIDQVLLARIASGDHHAFRVLFDLYHNKVYGYAYRFLRSEAQSKEIVQEVFIKIWLRRAELNSINNFGGYLRVVSKNLTLNALKNSIAAAAIIVDRYINYPYVVLVAKRILMSFWLIKSTTIKASKYWAFLWIAIKSPG